MVIIPVAAVCVAGAGTVGYFKVAHTKLAQKTAAKNAIGGGEKREPFQDECGYR